MSKFSNVDESAFNQRDRTPSRRGAGQTLVPQDELKAAIDRAKNGGNDWTDMWIDHKYDEANMLPGQREYRKKVTDQHQGITRPGDDHF